MIGENVLKIIKGKIIKHNLYKNSAEFNGANDTHEHDYCLYINPKYPNKYFVLSKESTFRGESLKNIEWNCYVFDGNGEELNFKTEKINLNDFVNESEKVCNIL